MALDPADNSAETEQQEPVLEQDAKIKVTVSCRRCAMPPQEASMPSETEGGQEDSEPVPTLEDLDCRFILTIFGATIEGSEESSQLSFQSGEQDEDTENLNATGQTWSHSFIATVTVNQETVIRMCRSPESFIVLRKAGLDTDLARLTVDLAPLVAGEREIELGLSLDTTELVRGPYFIPEFTVKVSIMSQRFLTTELESKLNPMCITIVAAEDLPDFQKYEKFGSWPKGANPKTLSLPELRESCLPAFCTYCFLPSPNRDIAETISGDERQGEEEISDWQRPVKTNSMLQAKVIKFKHKKVYLVGLIHPQDFIQHLKTTPLFIEVHDRDKFYPPTLDPDDDAEETSKAPPIWSGLKSIDKSRASEALPQNPCAVCQVNLAPLCDGRKVLVERCNLWPKNIKYPDFSAHPKPTPGDYVNSGSVLVVKVTLCSELKVSRDDNGPFQRVVICFRYSNADALQRLNSSIVEINSQFLGNLKVKPPPKVPEVDEEQPAEIMEGEPVQSSRREEPILAFKHEAIHSMLEEGAEIEKFEKGLSTIELTSEECRDPAMNIITGVQVIDNTNRIFILEGPSECIGQLLQANPRAARNSKEYKMLYHPQIKFDSRLYGAYHVVIKKIKLRENMKQLIANVTTYLEPKYALTAWALIRLHEIVRAGRMRTLRDLILFPEVEQLNHMEKKVGDALTIEDITGMKSESTKLDRKSEEEIPRLSTEELAKAVLMPRPKHKAPTDCENLVYLQYLASKPSKDFVQQYINERPLAEPKNTVPSESNFDEVYNYGGQSLQYTNLQREFRQEKYIKDYGKVHWTYSKDLLSGAMVLVDPEQAAKAEKKRNKDLWLTKEGFQWPKVSVPKEINSIEKKQNLLGKALTDYSVAETRTEWVENQWNSIRKGYEKPNLEDGKKDFNVRYNTALKLFERDPQALKSVFSVESGAALEAQERKQETHKTWSDKMVVDSKNFQVLWNSGTGQTSRLQPLLKNKPATLALRTMPHVEGCQPGAAHPPSIFTQESYKDPLRTYVVKTYGSSLHVEPDSAEGGAEGRVLRWNKDLAVGVIKAETMETMHGKPFVASGNKPKETLKLAERLHVRPIKPLGSGPDDRPPKLYMHTYQRGSSAAH